MHFKQYKSLLSAKNGINIYRGCSHGCIYCDSRSNCYNMDHDFEDIEVKENAPKMLEQTLAKKRNKCIIGTGAMCDPYLHIEEKLEYTRECLKVIDRYGFGLSILTKSNLILRDLDLIKSINQKTKCVVQMTLTTYNEKLCKILEPNVCTTFERFKVLETMKQNDIPTVVWLCPVLPFINDTEENLLGIIDYCIKANVKGILCFGFGVTLREGDREYFYSSLDKYFPGMKQKYISKFGNAYECNSDNNYKLMSILRNECKKHNIMYKPNDIFNYLNEYPKEDIPEQLSLF